jgi:hypothetical protein
MAQAPFLVTDRSIDGAYLGDFVTFSDASITWCGVITALVLNQEYEVTNVVDGDTYEITAVCFGRCV